MDYRKLISAAAALYLVLGCWKGHIALFEEGAAEPRQIFPNKVESLPQADRDALTEGILIRNGRQLEQLLEDYLS